MSHCRRLPIEQTTGYWCLYTRVPQQLVAAVAAVKAACASTAAATNADSTGHCAHGVFVELFAFMLHLSHVWLYACIVALFDCCM